MKSSERSSCPWTPLDQIRMRCGSAHDPVLQLWLWATEKGLWTHARYLVADINHCAFKFSSLPFGFIREYEANPAIEALAKGLVLALCEITVQDTDLGLSSPLDLAQMSSLSFGSVYIFNLLFFHFIHILSRSYISELLIPLVSVCIWGSQWQPTGWVLSKLAGSLLLLSVMGEVIKSFT